MILITGATGFVGQHLVAWLANQQYPVCALIHPSQRERRFAPGVSIQIVSGDVSDPAVLRLAMHQVDAVFHLAGTRLETAERTFDAINVQGTHNLIEAMREAGVSRLISLSPIGADTHSAYPYLRSKGLADELIAQSSLDYTVIRSSAAYGSGDHFTETIAMALRRLPLYFPMPGDGRSRLQPIAVHDLITCFDACLNDQDTIKHSYTIGGPQAMTFEEMVNLIGETIHHRRRMRYLRAPNALRFSNFIRGLMSGRWLYTQTDLDLLSIDRTTTMDSVAYQFGFTPARMSASLDYLIPAHRRSR